MIGMWQKARVTGAGVLPDGTELWIRGPEEAMPAEVLEPGAIGHPDWQPPIDAGDTLVLTHIVLPTGQPLYARRSKLELLGEVRDRVPPVELLSIEGAKIEGVKLGRDYGQTGLQQSPADSLLERALAGAFEGGCEVCGCTQQRACPGGCGWSIEYLMVGRAICTTPACVLTAAGA